MAHRSLDKTGLSISGCGRAFVRGLSAGIDITNASPAAAGRPWIQGLTENT